MWPSHSLAGSSHRDELADGHITGNATEDVHADVEPVGVEEAIGGQRLQRRAVVLLEEGAPRQAAVAPQWRRRARTARDAE